MNLSYIDPSKGTELLFQVTKAIMNEKKIERKIGRRRVTEAITNRTQIYWGILLNPTQCWWYA